MDYFIEPTVIEGLGLQLQNKYGRNFWACGYIANISKLKKKHCTWQMHVIMDWAQPFGRRIFQKPIVLLQKWKQVLSGSIAGCFVICVLLLVV